MWHDERVRQSYKGRPPLRSLQVKLQGIKDELVRPWQTALTGLGLGYVRRNTLDGWR